MKKINKIKLKKNRKVCTYLVAFLKIIETQEISVLHGSVEIMNFISLIRSHRINFIEAVAIHGIVHFKKWYNNNHWL